MIRVTLDQDLMTKLGNLSEAVELVDQAGRVMARVSLPHDVADYDPWIPPALTPEEQARRDAITGARMTTAQLHEHLRKL